MALVIQAIDAVESYVPYERPPQPAALWTAIPRGLVSFIVDGQQLDLKPINDTFQLKIDATLPPQFAYVFADLNFTLTGSIDFSKYDNFVNLNLQNFFRTPSSLALALNGNWISGFQVNGANNQTKTIARMADNSNPWPKMVVVAPPGTSGVLTSFTATNQDSGATVAGIVHFYASWWQFDLEQIRKYPINTAFRTY